MRLWGFHYTQLSAQVTNAIDALSVDEQRASFKPTLWTQDPRGVAAQNLKQVWLAGVHSEVGGGTDDNSSSDIALLWMAEQARLAGLGFLAGQPHTGWPDKKIAPAAPDYAGELHDSRHGFFELEHPSHRLAGLPVAADRGQSISSTAARRAAERIDRYAPEGFDARSIAGEAAEGCG